jgi:hypothetical protein
VAQKKKSPSRGTKSGKQETGKPAFHSLDVRGTGWREETLARMRALILEADPGMTEERKWKKPSNGMAGVPVWSHNGIVCTGETYTKVVKLTFAHGASIPDPSGVCAALRNKVLCAGQEESLDRKSVV